jgi:hypothetical protein
MQTLKVFITIPIGIIILIIFYNINMLYVYLYLLFGIIYVIYAYINYTEEFFPKDEKAVDNIIVNIFTILLGIICWLPNVIGELWER